MVRETKRERVARKIAGMLGSATTRATWGEIPTIAIQAGWSRLEIRISDSGISIVDPGLGHGRQNVTRVTEDDLRGQSYAQIVARHRAEHHGPSRPRPEMSDEDWQRVFKAARAERAERDRINRAR